MLGKARISTFSSRPIIGIHILLYLLLSRSRLINVRCKSVIAEDTSLNKVYHIRCVDLGLVFIYHKLKGRAVWALGLGPPDFDSALNHNQHMAASVVVACYIIAPVDRPVDDQKTSPAFGTNANASIPD